MGQRSNNNKEFLDEYETPELAARQIINYMINVMKVPLTDRIWEPACGKEKRLTNFLTSHGFTDVVSSDINYGDKIDFLTTNMPKGTKLIITNPPWSINKKFFARAVQLGVPFIFLVKLELQNTKYLSKIIEEIKCCGLVSRGKYRFLNPLTSRSIQMNGVFWFIGHWIHPEFIYEANVLPMIYYKMEDDENNIIDNIEEDEDSQLWNPNTMLQYFMV